MNLKRFAVLSVFIIFIMVITLIAFAEESVVAPADPTAIPSDWQVTSKDGSETLWAWGEVTNLDAQAKTLTLKYLDYETDQEKELVLAIDEKTVFENINTLEEIKIKDTLSIDYTIGVDGKNIAKNINFEKPDSSSNVPAQAVENDRPAEVAVQPVVDTSMQAAVPVVETPAPVEVLSVPAETSVPVVQEGQAQ